MKDLFEKHKKKIIVTISAGILYLLATFGLGIQVDVDKIFNGDVSEIGQQIEDAPEAP